MDTITIAEDGATYVATCGKCRQEFRTDSEATAVQRAREHLQQHDGEELRIVVRDADGTERNA